MMKSQGCALGFEGGLKKPPADALYALIPDNGCILCLTALLGPLLEEAPLLLKLRGYLSDFLMKVTP